METFLGRAFVHRSPGRVSKGDAKVHTVMREFKAGTLHSGSPKGPVVRSRDQAIAIAMSEAGRSRKKGTR